MMKKIMTHTKRCDILEIAETFDLKHLKKSRVYDTMIAFASPILEWSERIEKSKPTKKEIEFE